MNAIASLAAPRIESLTRVTIQSNSRQYTAFASALRAADAWRPVQARYMRHRCRPHAPSRGKVLRYDLIIRTCGCVSWMLYTAPGTFMVRPSISAETSSHPRRDEARRIVLSSATAAYSSASS